MGTVYLVDDDPDLRALLSAQVKALGHSDHAFASSTKFVERLGRISPGVVVVAHRMPSILGLKVLAALTEHPADFHSIMVVGTPNIPDVVEALKRGALDVLCQPISISTLGAALANAFAKLMPDQSNAVSTLSSYAPLLTKREFSVMRGMIEGFTNREIAGQLGIKPRTVEMHRANLMAKLGVRNLGSLVHLVFRGERRPPRLAIPSRLRANTKVSARL